MSYSNKIQNTLKKDEYEDEYINMFKKCLDSTDDKYVDAIKLYTFLMLNIYNNTNSTYLFSKLYIYLWKHNKQFAEYIMNSIIDSDDIQYLECYYRFERILDFAKKENYPYEEQYYMYKTFSCLMGRRLKKDWNNYISGSLLDISYCVLWFINKHDDNKLFDKNVFNNNGDYSFDNKSYLYHFIVNNNKLIYEMAKSACDKKIEYLPFDWYNIVRKLNKRPNDYTYINTVLKKIIGLLYNEIEIRQQWIRHKITKPFIFNTNDECYSLICFVNEYIKNTHSGNNIFTILPKEIIIKIITGSNDNFIHNIINNFFYHK